MSTRIFTPYRFHRIDWRSGWYVEWTLDWHLVGFCAELSFGSESIYGYEYGFDLQLGPWYLECGFCRSHVREAAGRAQVVDSQESWRGTE